MVFKYLILLIFCSNFCLGQKKSTSNNIENVERKIQGFSIAVNSKVREITMTKEEFSNAIFSIFSYYTMNDDGLKLLRFKVKYPGFKEIEIEGTTLNKSAKNKLKNLKRGDIVLVYDAISSAGKYIKSPEILGPVAITIF